MGWRAVAICRILSVLLDLNFKTEGIIIAQMVMRFELKDMQYLYTISIRTLMDYFQFHSFRNTDAIRTDSYFCTMIGTPNCPKDFHSDKCQINSLSFVKRRTGNKFLPW